MKDYSIELEDLKRLMLYRVLRSVKIDREYAIVDGKRCLLLCSNDYLGLASDARVINAMKDSINGIQCSSRLVAGNDPVINRLEKELARHKGFEKALVYPTGYMANLAIAALADEDTLIVSDMLNHASIIDACKLSKAQVKVYRHNDINDLKDRLNSNHKHKIIVTEGVFSMDGDFGKLYDISRLAKEYNAMLILDDAHGDFIYGNKFKGTQEYLDADVDIIISSLSKALGCFGGYVASNEEVIDYLINRSRSFIYTSALPSHIAYGALEALRIVKEGYLQSMLFKAVDRIKEGLIDIGYDIVAESHIIPIIIGDEGKALRFSNTLLEHGIFAQAIRYPSVERGKARIRLSISALHLKHVDDIIDIFKRCYSSL